MSVLDDKINSLSSDDLDLLNSDPKMLNDFKAKYSQPESTTMDKIKADYPSAALNAIQPALSLADPIANLPGLVKQGSQMMSQPKETAQAMAEPILHPIAYGKEHPVSQAINLGSLIAGGFAGADEAAAVKTGMGDIVDKIGGTFAEKPTEIQLSNAESAVQNALNKAKTMAEGKLNAVKKKFSTPPNFEDVSDVGEPKPSLANLKDKFVSYFSSRAPKMEEAGMKAPQGTNIQQPPQVEVYSKGTMGGGVSPNTDQPLPKTTIWGVRGDPSEIEKLGFGKEPGSIPEDTLRKFGLIGDNGPVTTVKGPTFTTSNEEIGHLINLRQGLQDEIRPTIMDQAGNVVKKVGTTEEGKVRNMIGKINDQIASLPGGDAIREAESHYSQARSIFDDLQGKMAEPGQTESFLHKLFKNPTGTNKDYINKLATVEHMTGEKVLSKLFDLYKQASQGLSYEELKHPLANTLHAGVPIVGQTAKGLVKGAVPPVAKGLQTPFNTPDMQSLRDKLNAQ